MSKPDKPTMGNVTQLSTDEWATWTGDKPKSDWSGLDTKAGTKVKSSNQLRLVHAGSQVKGCNHCKRGVEIKFKKTDDIIGFQTKIWSHLKDCGVDAIACISNPAESTMMRSIITNCSQHTKDLAKMASAMVTSKFDQQITGTGRWSIMLLRCREVSAQFIFFGAQCFSSSVEQSWLFAPLPPSGTNAVCETTFHKWSWPFITATSNSQHTVSSNNKLFPFFVNIIIHSPVFDVSLCFLWPASRSFGRTISEPLFGDLFNFEISLISNSVILFLFARHSFSLESTAQH